MVAPRGTVMYNHNVEFTRDVCFRTEVLKHILFMDRKSARRIAETQFSYIPLYREEKQDE